MRRLRIAGRATPTGSGDPLRGVVGQKAPATVASMRIATGTYSGDGNDDRDITGVGFTPEVVIVVSSSTDQAVWRTTDMPANTSSPFNGTSTTTGIKSFASGSFRVGTAATVNGSGTTYYYLALAGNGAGDFAVGTYTGDGNDDRNITDADMTGTPDFVLVQRLDLEWISRFELMPDTHSCDGDAGGQTNFIQDNISGGFQVGTQGYVNANGTTFYYLMLKAGDNLKVGSYTGNGTTQNITGLGITPDFVIAKGNYYFAKEASTAASDSSNSFRPAIAETAGLITGLISGGFSVGSYGWLNVNAQTEYYLAFKEY